MFDHVKKVQIIIVLMCFEFGIGLQIFMFRCRIYSTSLIDQPSVFILRRESKRKSQKNSIIAFEYFFCHPRALFLHDQLSLHANETNRHANIKFVPVLQKRRQEGRPHISLNASKPMISEPQNSLLLRVNIFLKKEEISDLFETKRENKKNNFFLRQAGSFVIRTSCKIAYCSLPYIVWSLLSKYQTLSLMEYEITLQYNYKYYPRQTAEIVQSLLAYREHNTDDIAMSPTFWISWCEAALRLSTTHAHWLDFQQLISQEIQLALMKYNIQVSIPKQEIKRLRKNNVNSDNNRNNDYNEAKSQYLFFEMYQNGQLPLDARKEIHRRLAWSAILPCWIIQRHFLLIAQNALFIADSSKWLNDVTLLITLISAFQQELQQKKGMIPPMFIKMTFYLLSVLYHDLGRRNDAIELMNKFIQLDGILTLQAISPQNLHKYMSPSRFQFSFAQTPDEIFCRSTSRHNKKNRTGKRKQQMSLTLLFLPISSNVQHSNKRKSIQLFQIRSYTNIAFISFFNNDNSISKKCNSCEN
ncbi:hypothetical protein RFI_26178 [Reticulomyxa filosa]|uniref:Uncharacterized protein n=1 Tax=Reticulomyxa filosa TaxID=46433 RepID=X6MB08_RETFI|nr:hypothetical protein RFI_26178 [Reticulomyxa filosa]|eukprot:ETO11198.1 hypothetical protein RFI_26178 [Reticulomyxa filosa]